MASAATSEIALTRLEPLPPPSLSDTPITISGVSAENDSNQDDQHLQEFSLPPVDGGKDAWLCLAGCFFIEALVWGK
jgi:hypothetical protein